MSLKQQKAPAGKPMSATIHKPFAPYKPKKQKEAVLVTPVLPSQLRQGARQQILSSNLTQVRRKKTNG